MTAISVENLSKSYRLGQISTGTFFRDFERWLARRRGRPDPYTRMGAADPASQDGELFWALRDLSFEVKQGEVLGIIGRNGAGKSTLLKILSRVTAPTSGQIKVRGRIASLLEVGTGFHHELTGRENMYLNGAILGMTRAEVRRKLDEIVAFAGIEQFIDTPVKRYSSGMYVRLAFAVAAHLEPEILVVDEVLAVGDIEFQKKCLGKMGEVAKGGRTVLFVSHQMSAIEKLCQRGILLSKGRLKAASGDIRSVINSYVALQEEEVRPAVWVNPGDQFHTPWFQPLRLSIRNAANQEVAPPFANNQDLWVHLEGRIETYDPALLVGYAIYSDADQLLYWSYQTDRSESLWPPLTTGNVRLRSKLPARLLNEGQYRIECIAGLHLRQWLLEPGTRVPAVQFEVQGGLSDSPYWLNKRPGLLAPVLSWERLDDV